MAYKKSLRNNPIIFKDKNSKIIELEVGLDFCLFRSDKGEIYGECNYNFARNDPSTNENALIHKKSPSSFETEERMTKL